MQRMMSYMFKASAIAVPASIVDTCRTLARLDSSFMQSNVRATRTNDAGAVYVYN